MRVVVNGGSELGFALFRLPSVTRERCGSVADAGSACNGRLDVSQLKADSGGTAPGPTVTVDGID